MWVFFFFFIRIYFRIRGPDTSHSHPSLHSESDPILIIILSAQDRMSRGGKQVPATMSRITEEQHVIRDEVVQKVLKRK